MADIEFVDGLLIKAPHEKAPDFVKAQIGIKVEALQAWLAKQKESFIYIDVKESKKGNWYAAVSTWKPKEKPAQVGHGKESPNLDEVWSSVRRRPGL